MSTHSSLSTTNNETPILMQKFLVIVAYLVLFFSAPLHAKERDLLSISLKELMAIPTNKGVKQDLGIFQSDSQPTTANSINFGFLAGLSISAKYSAVQVAAIDLAVSEINSMGGIGGRPLTVLRGDDHHSPDRSVKLAKKMIELHRVEAILGPVTSDNSYEVLRQVAIPLNIPAITSTATANQINQLPGIDLYWRLVPSNRQQVNYILDHLDSLNRLKRVYVVAGRDLYSNEILDGIKLGIERYNGKVTGELRLTPLADIAYMDLQHEMNMIRKSNPTAIIITLPVIQIKAFLQKIEALWRGPLPTIFLGDTMRAEIVSDTKLDKVKKCVQYIIPAPTANLDIENQIRKLLNTDSLDYDATYIYDMVMLFAFAKTIEYEMGINFSRAVKLLTASGKTITKKDYPQLIPLLKKHKQLHFVGISGSIRFDEYGDNIDAQLKLFRLIEPSKILPKCQQKIPEMDN
ncbi:ABC transporter substrate-binding protein [Aliikangiella coralliicola]|uniref:Amino acid ABC transporter substrate-binding protein n=1 Tax=Aliikangiella coralliicola TaxID=2592383 RepID=A0A545UH86_9GAMM|nr:ABC transporter substrate-binding protein [Aliikangiella coralliicola]TQV88834.1 amino acid ABC transporter substrate-binding protein [Aliikangiella coralliicola]